MLYADGFRQELSGQGYAVGTTDRNVRILAHFSYWMEGERVAVGELTSTRVEEFVAQRRSEGYREWLSVPAVGPLMGICVAWALPLNLRWRCRPVSMMACLRTTPLPGGGAGTDAGWCASTAS